MEDQEWPDKSPAKRERQHRAYERRYSEWREVLCVIEEQGRHPSPDYLADLIRRTGVPDFAREYVARCQTNPLPPGRPIASPRRPTTAEELDVAIATGRHLNHGAIRIVADGLTRDQYLAVRAFQRRHLRYAAFETQKKPRRRNLPRLRHIKSRDAWKVEGPQDLALKRVGRRYCVAPTTLKGWAQQLQPDPR